jgi:hypothetical protein
MAIVGACAAAAPVKPTAALCDRPVVVVGASTIIGKAVVDRAGAFTSRLELFFRRVCGEPVAMTVIASDDWTLLDAMDEIAAEIARKPSGIFIFHFPGTDLAPGTPVDLLLQSYKLIFERCNESASVCIVGGQQPANHHNDRAVELRLELERKAAAAFGARFLPLHKHFESETTQGRIMLPVDSGDGRHLNAIGQEVLFQLYRRRLLELTGHLPPD